MPKIPYPAKHYLKDGDALKTFSGQKKTSGNLRLTVRNIKASSLDKEGRYELEFTQRNDKQWKCQIQKTHSHLLISLKKTIQCLK
jgi:hypothetical protein